MSRLDYCNGILWGLEANELNHPQKIQNAAARIVTRIMSQELITPVLRSLHWLPVTKRIEHKILCFTYQFAHKTAPQYLQELVSKYHPPHFLRSCYLCRLSVSGSGKNTNKKCSGAGSFCSAAPTLWNRLPDKLHQAKDIGSFWRQLKSHLFSTLRSSYAPRLPPFIVIPPHPIPHVFLLLSYPPPFSICFAKRNEQSMWFSCMESNSVQQVDIDITIHPVYLFATFGLDPCRSSPHPTAIPTATHLSVKPWSSPSPLIYHGADNAASSVYDHSP